MKTILIDLWGTLIQLPEQGTIEQIIKKLNLPIKHHELIKLCDKEGLFSKTIDAFTIWNAVLTPFEKSEAEIKQAHHIWMTSSENATLFPQTTEFLKELKAKGFTLILASAIGRDSFLILDQQFKFNQYFDHIKTTFQVGLGKSPEYYEHICTSLQLEPRETIMIGDNIDYDIIPANKKNLHTIYLSRFLLTDYEKDALPAETNICSSFQEVLSLLI